MSHTRKSETPAERLAYTITCPKCGAKPYQPCRHMTSYQRNDALAHPHRERHFGYQGAR